MKKKTISVIALLATMLLFVLEFNDLYAIPPIDKACVYSVEVPGGPIEVECMGAGEICGDSVKCQNPNLNIE